MRGNEVSSSGSGRPTGRTFSLSFSFGKKPPIERSGVEEPFGQPLADAADAAPDAAAEATTRKFTLDYSDGKLRIGSGDGAPPYEDASSAPGAGEPDPEASREREMWDRLGRIADGTGAYPDTARWHRRLSMFVWAITIALPVAALILTLATGQTQETVAVVTFGALLVAAMFRSSVR